jgi:glycosyltransferase involved in cell wall biosynthesis
MKVLSILIPVYNEEATLETLLNKVQAVQLIGGMEKEIIVVNDGSKDKTQEVLEQYLRENKFGNVVVKAHEVNKGKGAAIHTGIALAKGDYVIVQDADLEYDPEEYNRLLNPIVRGFADVVYGSRFRGSEPHRILFFFHSMGNQFLTMLSNFATNLNLTDMESCYKVFDAKMLKGLTLQENRFGFEPEVTAKIARIPKIRIYEVGISYYGRTYAEGKKINWKDGFRAIYCIVKYGILRL